MAAVDEVDAYLVVGRRELGARRLAHAEWGIVVPGENAGGDPIEASIRIADGLLRVQALALHARQRPRPLDAALVEPPDAHRALRMHALEGHLGARGHPGIATRTSAASTACSGS